MARSITLYAAYPGRPNHRLRFVVARHSVSGNRSRYEWTITAERTGGSVSFAYDCFPWAVAPGGGPGAIVTGCHGLAFSSGVSSILLGSGLTGWFAHDANGNLNLSVSAFHGPASIFGTADIPPTTFVTDRIAQVPPAPNIGAFSPNPDQITTNSMRVRFSSTGDGGSPITRWQLQYSTAADFSNPTTINSSGTSTVTGLQPGTTYYFRARGVNAVGNGTWSATRSGTTLPATAPGMLVAPAISGTQAVVTLSPPSGSSAVTSYQVERRPVGGVAVPYSTTTPTLTVSGLTPGASYEWRARAMIGSYASPWTDWAMVAQPQPGLNPGGYFDGSTPDVEDFTFEWDGTPNNSTSRAVALAPLGWRGFPSGNAASGGLGSVTRATGGRSGAYGARVTFTVDTTSPGFRAGTAVSGAGVIEVAEGGIYWGSIFVAPSRAQRMAAELIWLDEAGAELGSDIGEAQIVEANPVEEVRLTARGTAPAGAVGLAVGWVDVAGDGWSPWSGGDSVMMDDAMASIGELLDWFSGDTPDTPQFSYEWEGEPNAAISFRTTTPAGEIDPLADPDCPPVPSAPTPPRIQEDCIEEVGSWRRYWAIIPADQVSQWLDIVPTIRVTTGASAARQVRIRVWRNPAEVAPAEFEATQWDAEQIISYMPPLTAVTLDGVARRVWAEVDGGAQMPADRLLYGTGGGPASWPVLDCGTAYLVSFDVPPDAPEGNLTVDVSLTTRML